MASGLCYEMVIHSGFFKCYRVRVNSFALENTFPAQIV